MNFLIIKAVIFIYRSEYKEGDFRSQVPLHMPRSFMCTAPVSPPSTQVGDSQMMLQMPKHPANTGY